MTLGNDEDDEDKSEKKDADGESEQDKGSMLSEQNLEMFRIEKSEDGRVDTKE